MSWFGIDSGGVTCGDVGTTDVNALFAGWDMPVDGALVQVGHIVAAAARLADGCACSISCRSGFPGIGQCGLWHGVAGSAVVVLLWGEAVMLRRLWRLLSYGREDPVFHGDLEVVSGVLLPAYLQSITVEAERLAFHPSRGRDVAWAVVVAAGEEAFDLLDECGVSMLPDRPGPPEEAPATGVPAPSLALSLVSRRTV